MRKYLHYFDRMIIRYVAKLPESVRPLMLFMTLLGQPPITVGAATGVVGFGIARNDWQLVTIGVIAITTFAICSILKIFLRRARPDNDYVRSMLLQTFSFPSGHATGSVVCFGLVTYLACLVWPQLAAVTIGIFLVVSFLIGVSRVYLGAHYPSDIIGGWIVGFAGLAAIITVGA